MMEGRRRHKKILLDSINKNLNIFNWTRNMNFLHILMHEFSMAFLLPTANPNRFTLSTCNINACGHWLKVQPYPFAFCSSLEELPMIQFFSSNYYYLSDSWRIVEKGVVDGRLWESWLCRWTHPWFSYSNGQFLQH